MQESSSIAPTIRPEDPRRAPQQDDIAQCARELWTKYGCPTDRDLEIWLQAEQRLFSATTQASREKKASHDASAQRVHAKQAHA